MPTVNPMRRSTARRRRFATVPDTDVGTIVRRDVPFASRSPAPRTTSSPGTMTTPPPTPTSPESTPDSSPKQQEHDRLDDAEAHVPATGRERW